MSTIALLRFAIKTTEKTSQEITHKSGVLKHESPTTLSKQGVIRCGARTEVICFKTVKKTIEQASRCIKQKMQT